MDRPRPFSVSGDLGSGDIPRDDAQTVMALFEKESPHLQGLPDSLSPVIKKPNVTFTATVRSK